jgi:hypothetical protein
LDELGHNQTDSGEVKGEEEGHTLSSNSKNHGGKKAASAEVTKPPKWSYPKGVSGLKVHKNENFFWLRL